MENFVDRQRPFPSEKICQYTELLNMGNRKPTLKLTCTTLFCKGHCVVPVYTIICHIFSSRWVLLVLLPIASLKSTMSFLCNHFILALQYHGCMVHFYARWCFSAHCKSSEAAAEEEMLELSAIISLHTSHPNHLILIHMISDCEAI